MATPASTPWRCRVCGYVHRGPAPPEECPVCGAPREEFERLAEDVPATESVLRPVAKQWRCLDCGYIHDGDAPPESCPVCGAAADRFAAVAEAPGEAPPAPAPGSGKLRILVAGAGIAGLSAAEAARQAAPEAEITLLSKEAPLPYYRLNLTRLLAGEITESQLPIHPESWYAGKRIELLRGLEAHALDLGAKTVQLRRGVRRGFDKLVLAGGAHPLVPPFPGVRREGVMALRTIGDAQRLLNVARAGATVVFIGGGILGMEAAAGLARQGAPVTLLEGAAWLLPRQLNERAGRLLAQHAERAGVRLAANVKVSGLAGDERVRAVESADGRKFPADLVVITTGVRPNSFLASEAGLAVNRGLVVDDFLATSHPDVYAAGDLTEHRGMLYGLWAPAQYQGRIAGQNAALSPYGTAGRRLEFGGLPRATTLKVLNVGLFTLGTVNPEDASWQVVDGEVGAGYAAFVFRESRLSGAILFGDLQAADAVKRAAEQRVDLSGLLRSKPGVKELVAHFSAR